MLLSNLQLLVDNNATLDTWNVNVTVVSDEHAAATATVQRIDTSNANAYQHWLDMGSPHTLTSQQLTQLDAASQLHSQNLPVVTTTTSSSTGGSSSSSKHTVTIALPRQGVAFVTFTLAASDGANFYP